MPRERVADLEVGLVLLTAPFLKTLTGALDQGARLLTQWGAKMSVAISAPLMLYGKNIVKSVEDVDWATRQVLGLMRVEAELVEGIAFDIDAAYKQTLESAQGLAMKFGTTVTDVLDGMFYVIGTGFETLKEAQTIMNVALKASVASGAEVTETVRAVVGMLNAYGLSAEYAAYMSDVLFMVVDKGEISFRELIRFMGRVNLAAATMGVSIQETGAIVAFLTQHSEWGRRAVTNLAWVLRQFASPSPAAKELIALALHMEDTTLAAEKFRQMMADPDIGVIKSLKMLADELGTNVEVWSKLVPSAWGMNAILPMLADNFEGVTEMLEIMNKASEGAGATQIAYEVQAESLRVTLGRLKAQAEVLGITLGYELVRLLAPAIDFLGSFIKVLREMPEDMRQLALKIALVAVALPPVLVLLGQLLSLGSAVVATALNPMMWAFAALALAVRQFIATNYEIRDVFDAIVALSDIAARAMEWGANAIALFAAGMIDAVGYVVEAVMLVAEAISWLLAPGSEPRALEGITEWGRQAMEQYLRGMTMADVSVIREIAQQISTILALREAPWQQLQQAYGLLLEVLNEYRETGEFSEDVWGQLAGLIGEGADQVREWLDLELQILDVERRRQSEETRFEEEHQALLVREERAKEEIAEIDRKIRDLRREQAAWDLETAEIPERFKGAYRRTFQMREAEMQLAKDSAADRADAVAEEIESAQEAHRWRMEELSTEQDLLEERVATSELMLNMQIELAMLRNQQAAAAEREKESMADLVDKLRDASILTEDWEARIGAVREQVDKIRDSLSLWERFFEGLRGVDIPEEEFRLLAQAEQDAYIKGSLVKLNLDEIKKSALDLWQTLGAIGAGFMAGITGANLLLPEETTEQQYEAASAAREFGRSLVELADSLSQVVKGFSKWWDGLSPDAKKWLLVLFGLQVTTGIPVAILTGLANLAAGLAGAYIQAQFLAGALGITPIGLIPRLASLGSGLLSVFTALGKIVVVLGVAALTVFEFRYAIDDLLLGIWNIVFGLGTYLFDSTETATLGFDRVRQGIERLKNVMPEIHRAMSGLAWFMENVVTRAVEGFGTVVGNVTRWIWERFVWLWQVLVAGSVVPDLVNAILAQFERLTDLRNLGNRIVDSLTRGLWENMYKVGGWVGAIIDKFEWLSRMIWGRSIIPEMTAGIVEEFEMMRRQTLGELDLMAGGLGVFNRVAGLDLAPAAVGFGGRAAAPTVEANFYHYWDASLSAKDRAELMAAAEAGTYDAMSQLFGSVAARPGGRWSGTRYRGG